MYPGHQCFYHAWTRHATIKMAYLLLYKHKNTKGQLASCLNNYLFTYLLWYSFWREHTVEWCISLFFCVIAHPFKFITVSVTVATPRCIVRINSIMWIAH